MTTPSSRLDRLLRFLDHDADNLALRQDAIREAFETGDWQAAQHLLETGLLAHPREPELLALSAFAHLQAQRHHDAERALLAALGQGLDAPELQYNLAYALFMQKRYMDALGHLAAPRVTQALPLALVLRARCQHHLDRPAQAIADCEAHLLVAAKHAETHGLLSLLLYEQHQRQQAQVHLEAALRQDPKQLEAMLAMASMQSDAQEYDAARSSFDALLLAHPQCGRAWLGLALIDLTQMQVARAKDHIELAAEHIPEHIGTWHVLAWVQIMRGDIAAAATAFGQVLALDRNFGETHGGLAVIAALQGRQEDARESIKRALRLDRQAMSARYAEMLLFQRGDQPKQAQEVLDELLTRPVASSDMQYRDLVNLHMKYLDTLADRPACPL